MTFRPALASCNEAAFPAKPEPTTTTSQALGEIDPDTSLGYQLLLAIESRENLADLPDVAPLVGGKHT